MSESEDLHPYDGNERRFVDTDTDPITQARGLTLVTRMLALPRAPARQGLRYELSFFSGGIGVFDRLFIAMPCTAVEADAIVAGLGMLAPVDAQSRSDASFEWWEADSALAFVDQQRRPFQPRPRIDTPIWFAAESDVNAWALIYVVEGVLGFIGFDQG